MSRLTSAQIIAQGHYLESDFEPSSLTVSQLLGVLGYHNIVYPSPYSKPKLIALFNSEIKPRASKFKKERLKAEASIASEEGITDGHTGEPLSKPAPVRRSSRRLSRAPSQEQEVSPVRPDPPKRRRSSAQPNLGGPSRKVEPAEPVLVEESEPEEEELPVRKIGRSKKAQAAGEQARRVSHAEDSGWEDNNVFQSGAESSSPARPRPKVTRKSVGPRKTRKSVSAPPEVPQSSSPLRSPPQSKFEPHLPPSVVREARILAPVFSPSTFVPQEHPQPKEEQDDTFADTDYAGDEPTEDYGRPDEGDEEEDEDEDVDEDEDHNAIISRRIAQGGNQLVLARKKTSASSTLVHVVLGLLLIATGIFGWTYKLESAPIGYCDMDRPTNHALEQLRARRLAIEVCHRENRTELADGSACPPPALPGIPHPDACTPCPEHGKCTQFSVECETGYLLRPNALLFFLPASTPDGVWRAIGNTTDGLPGLGSVGLPPRCVEDPRRKQRLGALGRAVEKELGQIRGRRVCAGSRGPGPIPDADGGDARRWGEEMGHLEGRMRLKLPSVHKSTNFEELFTTAIQQLSEWGGVIIGEDASGKRYVALKTADLTWDCAVIVKSREAWQEWSRAAYGIMGAVTILVWGSSQRGQQAAETRRVAELVQTALDTLRAQDRAYHTDPLSAAVPYLSSLQLRDVVLANEHSVSARARLWKRVEHVVEGNANVRANLEEVGGGDELRVWRWVGAPSPTKGN
ncbi:Man1-Src1p-C-terminal domain-containing protein [Roridomyces roridus]|uniref:Man1-Src1p-C-terminal domain-containing protein n=1 Tax=Roridomyces roridus TaxID=1738132 RepID=A0AAD7BWC5_9AGAR|nr:Man1-Src1p-C-terminal domain-containing protein [Roridomyces roridus]